MSVRRRRQCQEFTCGRYFEVKEPGVIVCDGCRKKAKAKQEERLSKAEEGDDHEEVQATA